MNLCCGLSSFEMSKVFVLSFYLKTAKINGTIVRGQIDPYIE